MVEKLQILPLKKRIFLTSAARADAATASSSKATRSPMSFRWQDAPEGSVSPNGLTFECGREAECVRRRWLPLSDGERYRGCTAAERRITWPQRSGINARTYTHSPPRYLSDTHVFISCAHSHARRLHQHASFYAPHIPTVKHLSIIHVKKWREREETAPIVLNRVFNLLHSH